MTYEITHSGIPGLGAAAISARGNTITTSGSSSTVGIPVTSLGVRPFRVRLSATAACYARIGADTEVSGVISAAGTGYAPGNVITLTGGTFTTAATLTVATTKVVSATIAAAGTGGTPGAATVTGTTGTGTKFQAAVTIGVGGDITSVDSISLAGSYTANPTTIAAEPVTGGGLTGAQLNVVMGVATVNVASAGAYSSLPSNPVSQGSVSPAGGTGATFTMTWATAAAAGDLLIQPNYFVDIVTASMTTVSAIQVTSAGVLQISPIEN